MTTSGVLQDMLKLKKKHNVFRRLNVEQDKTKQYTKKINNNKIKEIYHFSAYQIHRQVEEIYIEINDWLDRNC